jgi:hypothetical protein
MTLTHANLLDAVRAAGRDRESFTCADVRQQLGLSTGDRKQLSRFYGRFRALQKDAANEIEKLGKDAYRLRVTAAEPPVALEAAPQQSEQGVVRTPEVAVPEVAVQLHEAVAALRAHEPDFESLHVVESLHVSGADAGEPAASVAPASKPRAPWLSRMASFFSRRPKNEVASGVAVGA